MKSHGRAHGDAARGGWSHSGRVVSRRSGTHRATTLPGRCRRRRRRPLATVSWHRRRAGGRWPRTAPDHAADPSARSRARRRVFRLARRLERDRLRRCRWRTVVSAIRCRASPADLVRANLPRSVVARRRHLVAVVVDEAEVWRVSLDPDGSASTRRLDDGGDAFCFDPDVSGDSNHVTWVGMEPTFDALGQRPRRGGSAGSAGDRCRSVGGWRPLRCSSRDGARTVRWRASTTRRGG